MPVTSPTGVPGGRWVTLRGRRVFIRTGTGAAAASGAAANAAQAAHIVKAHGRLSRVRPDVSLDRVAKSWVPRYAEAWRARHSAPQRVG